MLLLPVYRLTKFPTTPKKDMSSIVRLLLSLASGPEPGRWANTRGMHMSCFQIGAIVEGMGVGYPQQSEQTQD